MKRSSVSVIALTAVSACGGSGTSQEINFLGLYEPSQAASPLAGYALINDEGVSYVRSVSDVSGSLQTATTPLTIEVDTIRLEDPDGPDESGQIFSTTSLDRGQIETTDQTFEFVVAIQLNETTAFTPPSLVEAEGFIGLATDVVDVPTTGQAEFRGIANGRSAGGSYIDSLAIVEVFFDTNSANLAVFQTGEEPNNGPRLFADGLEIDGNEISGGTTIFGIVGEDQIDVASMGADINGTFFGYDPENKGPDEVGIAVSTFGTEGETELIILAD